MIHGHCTECDTSIDCADLFLALCFHAAVRTPLTNPANTPAPVGYCPFCLQGRTQIAGLCRECYLEWQSEEDRAGEVLDYRADIRDLVPFDGWILSERELDRSGVFHYLTIRNGALWSSALVGAIQDGLVSTRGGGGPRREEATLPEGAIRCHCNHCR